MKHLKRQGELKPFFIKKKVMAVSVVDAVGQEKYAEVTDVWLDEKFEKPETTNKIGFIK